MYILHWEYTIQVASIVVNVLGEWGGTIFGR